MKISVVIPVYNSQDTILDTLLSIKNQTLIPYEVIIINDGSTDDSERVIKTFISETPELNIIYKYQINKGVSAARNHGMKLSQGNWIAFLDSDDVWNKNKLNRQVEVIKENPFIDFLGTTRNDENVSWVLWKKFHALTRVGPRLLLVKNMFPVPTVLFKSSILQEIGMFDENQKYAEEGIFFIKIANSYRSYLLNQSFVLTGNGKANYGESGLSSNLYEMQKGEFKNINESFKLKIINFVEYTLIVIFSGLKYVRRIIKVTLRKKNA